MNRNDVNRKTWYLLILMPIIYLAVSVLVVFLVKNNGAYPTGSRKAAGILYIILCGITAWRLCVTGHHLQHIIWHYAR